MDSYKVIDINNWIGKKHYLWFKEYAQPYYLIASEIDLTKFYEYIKKNNYGFFISLIYIVTKALNRIEEFRLRIVEEEVRLYDVINPAFTIMTDMGVFDNCVGKFFDSFKDFCSYNIPLIEKGKKGINDEAYNTGKYNEFFITSLPWLSIKAHTHPMTADKTDSFPRISWDKMVDVNGVKKINMSIQVNHALVDGYPLSKGFIEIQNALNNPEEELK